MGYWVLGLSILVSMAGALMGLICVRQSTKSVTAKFRMVWLASAAVSIGGIGTWLAVFVSMLGVEPSGDTLIRYDVTRLTAAAVLAVVSVFAGLVTAGRAPALLRLVGSGVLIGVGSSLAMALGMSAVRIRGELETNVFAILAATLLAIGIAVATLWFALGRRSALTVVGAAALFGLAVAGTHFVRMAGVEMVLDPRAATPEGDDLFSFLVPMFVVGTLSLSVPITAVLVAPDRRTATDPVAAPARQPEPPRQSAPFPARDRQPQFTR
ncbi:NO-binding membrane sensor protein with MHYT domain [Nocardia puris]|uniref:NO-binding membrane sensor protein with MHYT domain n=2 Tax=Nocardia puris TaxID=208602 RepID=A0A366D4T9_9NOCA|nr:NO-binding membrane sensor protein with MHYT domain [Nocardia puris]